MSVSGTWSMWESSCSSEKREVLPVGFFFYLNRCFLTCRAYDKRWGLLVVASKVVVGRFSRGTPVLRNAGSSAPCRALIPPEPGGETSNVHIKKRDYTEEVDSSRNISCTTQFREANLIRVLWVMLVHDRTTRPEVKWGYQPRRMPYCRGLYLMFNEIVVSLENKLWSSITCAEAVSGEHARRLKHDKPRTVHIII